MMTRVNSSLASRGRSALPSTVLLALVCACLLTGGCARQVSLADLGSSGAVVWVRLTTSDEERVEGEMVSLDAGSMVVLVKHELRGDVRVRERDGASTVYSGTERLPGEFVRIESSEDRRVAVVQRTFRASTIATATFHENKGERSLGSIVSLLLGPVVGGVLAFVL